MVQKRVDELQKVLRQRLTALKKDATPERCKAAEELGKLKQDAWDARRDLCATMLEAKGSNQKVYHAVYDALLSIDPRIHSLAKAIVDNHILEVAEIKKLGKGAEPLTPLVMRFAEDRAGQPVVASESIKLLPLIAPKDREAAERMGGMLQPLGPAGVSETIAIELRKMDYAVLATSQLLPCTSPGIPQSIRFEAVATLLFILERAKDADAPLEYKVANTQKKIKDKLRPLKFDSDPRVSKFIIENLKILEPN
jgi:hypothetical protein